MADFCRDCVADLWPDIDATDIEGPTWALCEGCGVHHFNSDGRRSCGRPTPGEGEVSIDACPACMEVV